MDTGRLEAFSDGVFAVAITLLALDLGVEGPNHGPLAMQLSARWPELAAYIVSFFIIGTAWVNHHALVSRFAAADRTLLFLNLLLLMFVVLIPFATATMAEYLLANDADAHVAGAFYGAVLEGMAAGFVLIFVYASRQPSIAASLNLRGHTAALQFGVGLIVYLLSIGVAFLSAPLALLLIGAAAVYYVFEHL